MAWQIPPEPEDDQVTASIADDAQMPDLPPVPPDTDDIGEIFRHAYEYDGYERHGGFDAVARIAKRCYERRRESGKWQGTVDELRCTLFFEQRAAHHQGESPTGEELELVRELYQTIRSRWGETRE